MREPDLLLETTVKDVRNMLADGTGPLPDELTNILDEAQGAVFSGAAETRTILITVKKE